MKTIKDWLGTLPEPKRAKALNNTCAQLNKSSPNLKEALITAFEWSKTPQGYDYWSNVYNSL